MILRGLETGVELVLTEPYQGLNEPSTFQMHIVEHQKIFPLGSEIQLDSYDIYSTIFTLWRFGLACGEALNQFAFESGIQIGKV